MASGVGVNQDCTTDFQDLKLRHKYKYLIYNLNKDNTQIITEKKGEDDGYEKFIDCLPETECRWAVYDFGYEHEGGKRNKLIFISWSPDTAKIKNKMVFAASKDAIRRALVGIATEIQATDVSELSHEAVLEKVSRLR